MFSGTNSSARHDSENIAFGFTHHLVGNWDGVGDTQMNQTC